MKIAITGSRSITDFNLEGHIPAEATEIISGGARGVDTLARQYAESHGLPCTEVLLEQPRNDRSVQQQAEVIVRMADLVIVVWDGRSHGTLSVMRECLNNHVPCQILRIKKAAKASP